MLGEHQYWVYVDQEALVPGFSNSDLGLTVTHVASEHNIEWQTKIVLNSTEINGKFLKKLIVVN